MMELLALKDVAFSYNGSFRLEGLNLSVSRGDFIGIIGPNGSGKSTLVKLLAGYLRPSSGAVLLEGQSLARLDRRAVAQKIAVVPQGVKTEFDFTVEEMVRLGRLPYLKGWQSEAPGDLEAIARAMALAKVDGFRYRSFSRLSGGEAQRVLVAQALAQQPQVLLLDEPTTYMDMTFQQELFNLLTQLNSQGITVVAVLHDINLAALYCKKLVAVRQGQIYSQGSVEEVVTAAKISDIFNCRVDVNMHPLLRRPQVILLPHGDGSGSALL